MTEIEADILLQRLVRQMTLGRWARYVIVGSLVAWLFVPHQEFWIDTVLLVGVFVLWLGLLAREARLARWANLAGQLAGAGRLAEAEEFLRMAAQGFTLFHGPKLLACHSLAVVSHYRHLYGVAARACEVVLRDGGTGRSHLARQSQLLLAESQLMQGNLPAVYPVLLQLHNQPLRLHERLILLPIQLSYEIRVGDFAAAARGLLGRLQLAELMPSMMAGAVHGMLALACRRLGWREREAWLMERARLYANPEDLIRRFPELAEMVKA